MPNSANMTLDSSVIQRSDDLFSLVSKDGDNSLCTLDDESDDCSLTTSAEQPCLASADAPAKCQIVSILRHSTRFSHQNKHRSAICDGPDETEDNGQPQHWPTDRPSVHFIDELINQTSQPPHTTPVTSLMYRPYTEVSELSNLYYTSVDFDQFKREYRALLKAQRRRKMGKTDDPRKDELSMKKSSFWRSKVHGRFYDPSNGTFSQPAEEEKEYRSSSSSAGLFSSVFDVAKEAVSIFSGSSNYSYYQNQTSPPSKTRQQQQQLLVDTLYSNLF